MPRDPTRSTATAGDGAWPALLSTAAAARYLDLSVPMLRRLHAAGRTPQGLNLGRKLMFRRADLDAWLSGGCRPRDADSARAFAAATSARFEREAAFPR